MVFNFWGKSKKVQTRSEFYIGTNILEKVSESSFGKVKNTLYELFSESEIREYALPKVIAIGTESSGKSSLLENITKCQIFPRDNKLCTKCPVHVKMFTGPSKYQITIGTKVIQLADKNEIYGIIYDHMNSIPAEIIDDNEILIEITDPNVLNFEFFDLPGIRAYPPELCEMTTALCRKYLKDKNSIILCVVPVITTRLTSCQSIALIDEMKINNNTILALTMADRLQEEIIEDLLIKRILRVSDELIDFAGCVAVMNRSHCDTVNLVDHDQIETEWFNNNIIKNIPPECDPSIAKKINDNITVKNLVHKMDMLYENFIKTCWRPRILDYINRKLRDLEFENQELGPTEFPIDEYNDKLQKLCDNIYDLTNFEVPSDLGTLICNNEEEIYHAAEKEINKYCNELSNYQPNEILAQINCFFSSDNQIEKFQRFDNIRAMLCQKIRENISKNISLHIKTVYERTIHMLCAKYCNSKLKINDIEHYVTRFGIIFRLLIIYPSLANICDFNKNDYVESIQYQNMREEINHKRLKLEKNLEKVMNL